MEALTKPKVKGPSLTRIILNEESERHLQSWVSQLKESCPGIRVKKQDLVNWLISERDAQLSATDMKAIKERFFGEIELAQWALLQLKAAKARNEKVTLAELIRSGRVMPTEHSPRKKAAPSKKSEQELPHNEAAPVTGNQKGEVL
jgi:hypothetical protein